MAYIPPLNGGRLNASISGNTAGTSYASSIQSTGTMVLAGGNNVTLSQSTNSNGATISFNAPSPGGFSAGMSTGGNTSGTTGMATNQLVIAGGNNIILSQATGAGGNTLTISASSQSNQTISFSAGSQSTQTATGTFDARSMFLNGVGAASVGFSNSSMFVNVPTQTAQTLSVSLTGNMFNSSTMTRDARSISFSAMGAASMGISNGIIQVSAPTQTVQTLSFVAGTTGGGNTSLTSTGTFDARSMFLNGLGAATAGFSSSSLFVSVPVQSAQTQNLIQGVIASGSTNTSGSISFANSNGVTFGLSNNTVTASFNPGVQGSDSIGISTQGNTAGTTGFAAGSAFQYQFAGGNNITLSQSVNGSSGTLSIVGANQTNQTIGMYATGNTTDNTSATFDARSMTLNGYGGLSAGYSNGSIELSAPAFSSLSATGALSISVNGNTVSIGAPAFSAGISNIGNTSGTSATISNQLILAGGNNVTLSQSSNSNGATVSISAGGGNVNFSAGTTSNNLASVTFANSNGVSFGLNGSVITASAASQSNQTLGFSAGGNTSLTSTGTFDARSMFLNGLGAATAGFSSSSLFVSVPVQSAQTQNLIQGVIASGSTNTSGSISFANSNGVTFGLSSNTITASVAGAAQSNQTLGLFATGNTTGNTTGTFDARSITFNGLGAASVGYSGGSVEISVPTQSIQTQNMVSFGGSTGNIVYSNMNNVTFGANASVVTASASFSQTNQTLSFSAGSQSTQTATGTFDARSMFLNGVGAASVGFSNSSMFVSVPVQSAQTQSNIQGIIASGSSNSTGNISFANSNGVTFGLSNNTITASAAGGGVALYDGANSITSGTAQFSVSTGALTISNAGQTVNFAAPATSMFSGTGAISISTNGNTISIGAPAMFDAGISNIGNTSGTSGQNTNGLVLAGGNNITLSQSTNTAGATITISGGGGGGNVNFSAGTTSNNLSAITFSNSNGVSFGLNGSVLTASAAGGGGGGVNIAGAGTTYTNGTANFVTAGGAITIGSSTAAGGSQTLNFSVPATSSLLATGAVSISTTGGTISIGAPQNGTIGNWEPVLLQHVSLSSTSWGGAPMNFYKLQPMAYISATQLQQLLSMAVTTSTSGTHSGSITMAAGIYTANGATLSLITQSSGSASYQFTNSSNASSSFLNGIKGMTIPMTVNMSPGNYWIGIWGKTTSGGTNQVGISNLVIAQNTTMAFSGILGQSANNTAGVQEGVGLYTSSGTALAASAAMSGITQSVFRSNQMPYLAFKNQTW